MKLGGLLAVSIPIHSFEMISLVAFSKSASFSIWGLTFLDNVLGLSSLGSQGRRLRDGHRVAESEDMGMERVWLKGGKGEHCSLIVYPVQPDPWWG